MFIRKSLYLKFSDLFYLVSSAIEESESPKNEGEQRQEDEPREDGEKQNPDWNFGTFQKVTLNGNDSRGDRVGPDSQVGGVDPVRKFGDTRHQPLIILFYNLSRKRKPSKHFRSI